MKSMRRLPARGKTTGERFLASSQCSEQAQRCMLTPYRRRLSTNSFVVGSVIVFLELVVAEYVCGSDRARVVCSARGR